jgi:hypothetical protein
MSYYHAVVWIDHAEAHVLEFSGSMSARKRVRNANHAQVHHKAGVIGSRRSDADAPYYKGVAASLADAGEILILGPSTAKLELLRYLHRHALDVGAKVVGVETVDHPTDAQVLAYARARFRAVDRMGPQVP